MLPDTFDRFAPSSTRAFAHAKLNLVLRVLAREASGYHTIETLFQALELADVVDVSLIDNERTLACHGPMMPVGGLGPVEQNLATRAAVAYTSAAKWETGWHIEIEKHIPVGGGLGGGSADAAAVLRALESLAPQPLGSAALMELAGTLGADVPFLLSGAPLAWAWSRGDRFMPLPALPRMGVALLAFAEGVNTGAAYGAIARARDLSSATPSASNTSPELRLSQNGAAQYPGDAFASWSSIAGLATNDFEPVVMQLHAGVARWLPVVRQATVRMTENGAPAIGMMSGSGATCFLLAPDALIPELGSAPGMVTVRTHTLGNIPSF
jgi:4-diphosphocytidyl-2-C-methyl-D-erythritol kinase